MRRILATAVIALAVPTLAATGASAMTAPKASPAGSSAASGAAPTVSLASTGGSLTFTISGSTGTKFEIQDTYNGLTKYHKFTGTSLSLKGKVGKTIKFRARTLSPAASVWSTWQTATIG